MGYNFSDIDIDNNQFCIINSLVLHLPLLNSIDRIIFQKRDSLKTDTELCFINASLLLEQLFDRLPNFPALQTKYKHVNTQ